MAAANRELALLAVERSQDSSSTDEESGMEQAAARGRRRSDAKEDDAPIPEEAFDEDMFGMMVVALIRDFFYMSIGKGTLSSRLARFGTTFGLLGICIGTQVFLLVKITDFVSARAVHDIRIAYDEYEVHMYNETYLTVNGKHRGLDGHFVPENFRSLTAEQQASACRIPLSQPDFFFVVLLIWTLTCIGEIKACLHLFVQLAATLGTCANMEEAKWSPEEDAGADDKGEHDDHEFIIKALPLWLKAVIFVFVIIPRLGITTFLLWVGCRWLLATNNFADLILNAVALEFILLLKEMMYRVLVPHRNKIDLGGTFIKTSTREPPSAKAFTQTLSWLLVAFAWVVSYMGIPHHVDGWQMVLPDYRWDLHDVCIPWVRWRYCVNPPCPANF